MAEITYIIQFLSSVILLAVGVFLLHGPGWSLIAAGAALFLSSSFRSVANLILARKALNGVKE